VVPHEPAPMTATRAKGSPAFVSPTPKS
jgi:hypothetical protein